MNVLVFLVIQTRPATSICSLQSITQLLHKTPINDNRAQPNTPENICFKNSTAELYVHVRVAVAELACSFGYNHFWHLFVVVTLYALFTRHLLSPLRPLVRELCTSAGLRVCYATLYSSMIAAAQARRFQHRSTHTRDGAKNAL